MESSLKTWLIRILFVLPVLCLIISVVLWKHGQNETFDIQTVKRELKEHKKQQQQLNDEVEKMHVQKRDMQNQIDSANLKHEQHHQQLHDEVEKMHVQKRDMQSQIDAGKVTLQQQQEQLHAEIDQLHAEKREVQNDKVNFKRQLQDDRVKRSTTGGGAVFVHWGRINCSSTTTLVYSGIAGGGLYIHTGAAVNMLCMTHNPVWGKYNTDGGGDNFVYGTEYQLVHPNDFPFGHDRAEKLNDHDVPCSVCRSATRTSVIMIPGTTNCTAGWTAEYSGYLMAGLHVHAAATEYNCIDANPDAHESGVANEDGRLLYRVKSRCGSLPCPPYVENRDITCVVCTK